MLLFKKKFLPAIRAGEKTQTIRLWKFRHLRSGQRSYIPGVGYIRINDRKFNSPTGPILGLGWAGCQLFWHSL